MFTWFPYIPLLPAQTPEISPLDTAEQLIEEIHKLLQAIKEQAQTIFSVRLFDRFIVKKSTLQLNKKVERLQELLDKYPGISIHPTISILLKALTIPAEINDKNLSPEYATPIRESMNKIKVFVNKEHPLAVQAIDLCQV